MRLGVCWYPEQWPEAMWAADARRMAALGLEVVRIGEFAWARLEPEPGRYDWGWLDRAIATLADAGLEVMLGTPTATPPKWLVDRMPDMLPLTRSGQPRGFGSRRHYCFSHLGYRGECRRVVTALGERYGHHPAVTAWQLDNEYGCHDTVLSWSPAARDGFRRWLRERYGTIAALNEAWGTTFWSQGYRSFDEVELPEQAVTEGNPAHRLDFRRFASDEVVSFNAEQAALLRALAPGRTLTHNFMGFFTSFDHRPVARALDVAGWDSYPLGFLDSFGLFTGEEKRRWLRVGHPDIAAFHHDLYRGVGRGRFAVLEQQPGPVNWSRHNPAPAAGMVRLWTLEAAAHGAELLSYFRWRQYPRAQEQLHAGLLRPDDRDAPALAEVRQAVADLANLPALDLPPARVALLFDYPSLWAIEVQPQGASFEALALHFRAYEALRRLGLDVDIVGPDDELAGYALIVAPCLTIVTPELAVRLEDSGAHLLLGPRSGSRTPEFAIPDKLPPGPLATLIPLTVARVESLPPECGEPRWVEDVEAEFAPELRLADGRGWLWRHARVRYLSAWPDAEMWHAALTRALADADIAATPLPPHLRLRRVGALCFAFNYGSDPCDLAPVADEAREWLLGGPRLDPHDVAVWRTR